MSRRYHQHYRNHYQAWKFVRPLLWVVIALFALCLVVPLLFTR